MPKNKQIFSCITKIILFKILILYEKASFKPAFLSIFIQNARKITVGIPVSSDTHHLKTSVLVVVRISQVVSALSKFTKQILSVSKYE